MLDHTANLMLKWLPYEKTFMKQAGSTTACAIATWAEAAKSAQRRAVLANIVMNAD